LKVNADMHITGMKKLKLRRGLKDDNCDMYAVHNHGLKLRRGLKVT